MDGSEIIDHALLYMTLGAFMKVTFVKFQILFILESIDPRKFPAIWYGGHNCPIKHPNSSLKEVENRTFEQKKLLGQKYPILRLTLTRRVS